MASWPGVSLSLYCWALAAVMVNSGFSFLKGSPRKPLASTGAAPGLRPPSHAGMLLSALPSFCAPSGVNEVPSCAASCSLTAAMTPLASRESARPAQVMILLAFMDVPSVCCGSEVDAEAERDEVPVCGGVELAAEEVRVAQACGVGGEVVGIHADADGLRAFLEVPAPAVHVMGPGQVRREVDAGDDVGVVQLRSRSITPGIGGVEAVAVALLLRVGRGGADAGILGTGEFTGAKHRATAKTDSGAIRRAKAIDAVVADFADQGQAPGTQDLIEELRGRHLRLHHRHPFVARQVTAQRLRGFAGGKDRRGLGSEIGIGGLDRCQVQVGGVDLQRHVRAVAQLATDGGFAQGGLETQPIKADVFRIIDEVARGTYPVELVLRHAQCPCSGWQGAHLGSRDRRNGGLLEAKVRVAAVVVHGIEAELGVVQVRGEPAQGDAVLATVPRIVVLDAGHVD